MRRTNRNTILAAVVGLATLLAAALGESTLVPTAARATGTGSVTGPLQNSGKLTYIALDTTTHPKTWSDRATTPGIVTYPAPGTTGVVVVDGTCLPKEMSADATEDYTIPATDEAACLTFDSEITAEGYFTFRVDSPGSPADGRYLGDGNSGGWLDLLSTKPLMMFAIPEQPAGTATLTGRAVDEDGDSIVTPRDNVVWSAEIENTGNVRLRDLDLGLPDGTPIDCDPSVVDAGATITCESDAVPLTQSDIDHGSLDATLTASAKTPRGKSFTFEQSAASAPLEARPAGTTTTGAVGDVPAAGSVVRVTTTLRNDGNVTLHDIVATVNDQPLELATDRMAPGDTIEHSFEHEVTQDEFDAGRLEFRTAATGQAPSGAQVTLAPSQAAVGLDRKGAVEATLRTVVGSTAPGVDDPVRLALSVRNTGNVSVHDVEATFDDLADVDADCPVPSLAPGATFDCDVTGSYTVTQADVDAGSVAFHATVGAVDTAGSAVSAEAGATQETEPQAPAVSMTVAPALHAEGAVPMADDVVTLAVHVQNTGNVTLHDLSAVIDDRAELEVTCPESVLAPSASTDCTVPEYALTQSDIDDGAVTFDGTVTAVGPKGQRTHGEDSASVTLDRRHGVVATASAELAGAPGAPEEGDHVDLAFTGSDVLAVVIPVSIVLLLCGLVLLVWLRRRTSGGDS